MLGNQLKFLRETKQKSQLEVCSALNIEQSTLANYENGKRIPKIDILIKIADYYDVPIDFLLCRGVFKDLNILLNNKHDIIQVIHNISSRLSTAILNGIDDITFIKLVDVFKICVFPREDGTVGVSAKDPFPTYPSHLTNNAFKSNANQYQLSSSKDKTAINEELLDLIGHLPYERQYELKGYVKRMAEESVAAEEPMRKASGK